MKKMSFIEWCLVFILAGIIGSTLIPKVAHSTGMEIKANTTGVVYVHFLNSSAITGDGVSGLNNTTASFYYSKNNGALAAMGGVTLTELNATLDPGSYALNYTTDLTDTLGVLLIKGNASGAVPFRDYYTIVANIESDTYAKANAANDTVGHADYGNAKLVRATTPANTLDTSTTGEAGLDFNNVKFPTTSTSFTNITIPTVTAITNNVTVTNCDVAISTRGTSNLTTSDNVGINWGDVSNPTTSLALSGTTISTSQAVASVSGAVGSVTGNVGGNIGGNVNGTVASVTGNVSYVTNDVGITQAAADKAWGTTTRQLTGTQAFNLTGNIIGNLSNVTNDVGITQASADLVWGTATRQLTGTQAFNNTGNLLGNVSYVTNPTTVNGGNVTTITGNINGNLTGTIGGMTTGALSDFFDTDSTTTYESSVDGSVVKELAEHAQETLLGKIDKNTKMIR